MRHDGGLLIRTVAQILLPRVLCSGICGGGPARRSRLAIEDRRRQRHLETEAHGRWRRPCPQGA
eukprot:2689405-Prymnesium_polylepis.1